MRASSNVPGTTPATGRRNRRQQIRKGSILVLAAVMMVVMLAMLAMSIDTGYMFTMQAQLDRSVDAAALAGAGALIDGTDAANESVIEYLIRNPVGQPNYVLTDDELVQKTAEFLAERSDDFEIHWGNWNAESRQFEETAVLPSAVSVSLKQPNLPFFFGRALGQQSFDLQSHAIAMYQPRDIMLVLDLSGSMNDDSEFGAIGRFGKDAIMDGLEQMYEELGSPVYGNLQFEPRYVTFEGVDPINGSMPKITVEYRYTSVYVTSTKDLSNVVLQFSNGSTFKFDGLSGRTGTFSKNKAISKIWVKSGANTSGDGPGYGEGFDFSSGVIRAKIRTALGLDGVPYPYQSGSWNTFIDYGRSNSSNKNAGFEYKFGYANLINYWLEQKAAHNQTADLWKVSAQPITAVKDAVDVFMEYVQEVDTNDRVGLVVYDGSDGNGKLESTLTEDFDYVTTLARQRQAGHYHDYTNIGAGMQRARLELQQRARVGAFKMIVLMTDGQANWNNGRYDVNAAYNHVVTEAEATAALNIPIVSISLGGGADIDLMQLVATITESRHFNIPGGQSVADYREGLFEVFRAIADSRPLKLVK